MPEGLEPSFAGCKPDVLPVGRRTRVVAQSRVAGRARTFNLGLRRAALVRSSCRNFADDKVTRRWGDKVRGASRFTLSPCHPLILTKWSTQDSNLQHPASEAGASAS